MTTTCTRYLTTVRGLRHAAPGKEIADWLRLGATLALADDRPAADLIKSMDRAAYALRHHAGWSPDLATAAQWPVAGLVVGLGLDAHRFAYECETVRQRLREGGMPDAGTWAPYVVACLRQWELLWPAGPSTVQAMGGLFLGLKGYHRWMTGADDLAICAALVGSGGSTAQRIEAIDRELGDIFSWAGNDIQTAACILALDNDELPAIFMRVRGLVQAFTELRSEVWQVDAAALALLALGAASPQTAAAEVLNNLTAVASISPLGMPAIDFIASVSIHIAGLPSYHSAGPAGRRLRCAQTVVIANVEHRLLAAEKIPG